MTDDPAEGTEVTEGGPALADLDTDRWRRLDPRMLLVHLVQEPIRFLPVLVGVLFLGRSANGGDEAWRYLAIPAVLVVGVLRYLTTSYRIGNGQIELRKGLLNKQILATPADRVRTVDVTSPPVHRILGLAKVELGTAGAGHDRIVLDALRVADARRLREELIHLRSMTHSGVDKAPVDSLPGEKPLETTLLRLDPRWVRYAPVTMTGVVSALALFGFANQYLTRLLEREVVEDAVGRIGDYPWWVDSLVGFVAVALLVTVLAVIGYALQFWGFRLTRHPGGTLHVTRGLFTSRESSIEEKRIRGLEVGEPLGLRLVGGGRLQVVTTGVSRHEDRRGTTWLVPPAPRAVVEGVAAAVLHDEEALKGPLTPHGASARRRRWVRALVPSLLVLLVVLVPTVAFHWPVGLSVAAFTPLLAVPFLARDRYAGLGHRLTPTHLVVRSGSLVRRRDILQRTGIIGWTVSSTWFQRRAGLSHLVATTAAGKQHYTAYDIPVGAAVALAHEVDPDLLDQFLAR
ncbi:MAG: PH domain-containing protein [Lapillicoccus sp.]